MFWGSFAGLEKGPCVFWEKEWGNITAERYSEYILPHVVQWMGAKEANTGNRLTFMHDNAPSHKAALTLDYLRSRGVESMFWPPYSPDLNPIESVWSMMKDFIQNNYPEFERGRQRTKSEVRQIIQQAWDSISSDQLLVLITSMPARCLAVINADGGQTKY